MMSSQPRRGAARAIASAVDASHKLFATLVRQPDHGHAGAGFRPTPRRALALTAERVPYGLRQAVFERDGHACANCGAIAVELHADYIVPPGIGGRADLANLITTCERCHALLQPAGR